MTWFFRKRALTNVETKSKKIAHPNPDPISRIALVYSVLLTLQNTKYLHTILT